MLSGPISKIKDLVLFEQRMKMKKGKGKGKRKRKKKKKRKKTLALEKIEGKVSWGSCRPSLKSCQGNNCITLAPLASGLID